MDRLLLELRGVSLRRNESNSWKWVLNQIGTYSVKATYVVLCDHHFASTKDDVLAHTWNLKVPPKIK